jgi:hypothetical protein
MGKEGGGGNGYKGDRIHDSGRPIRNGRKGDGRNEVVNGVSWVCVIDFAGGGEGEDG